MKKIAIVGETERKGLSSLFVESSPNKLSEMLAGLTKKQAEPKNEEQPVLSPQTEIFVRMSIEHYKKLYIPAATAKGFKNLMPEREYVALALENLAEFEAHLAHCELFGHKDETIMLGETQVTACARCGLTQDMAKIFSELTKEEKTND